MKVEKPKKWESDMLTLEFDDIIYALQRFGGASVYWKEVTGRVAMDPKFKVQRTLPKKYLRGVPAFSSARIFHSSHFRDCWSPKTKVVSTVHDLTYELGFVGQGLKAKINILERKHSYFKADALICISESTRTDLLNVYPQLEKKCPIYVIHHGFERYAELHESDLTEVHKKYHPYILYVGARAAYKNFTTALNGFRESNLWQEGFKLLCTGSSFTEEELQTIKSMNLHESVIAVGNVDRKTMASLYRNAYCLMYTSVKEGFGLPLVEAMSLKCPVIASNASCIPEIVGEAALLAEPYSPTDVAKKLLQLQDSKLRTTLIDSGLKRVDLFSWDKSAELHKKVYLDIS